MRLFIAVASGLMSLLLALNLNAQIQVNTKQQLTEDLATSLDILTPLPTENRRNIDIDPAIKQYDLLRLDPEMLATLKAAKTEQLRLEIPAGDRTYALALSRTYPAADQMIVRYASGNTRGRPDLGLHYRGTLIGQPETHVALSLMDGELQGLIALADGTTLVLGPLTNQPRSTELVYLLYQDDPIFAEQDFECGTDDSGVPYSVDQLNYPGIQRSSTGNCVKVYFEVDYNIFQNKGANTAAYIVAAFNEVAALFAEINVNLSISELFIWDQFSPYGGSSSGTLLTQFQSERPSFNGDIAQLLSYSASGGIAVLSGLCHPISAARMSFSSIGSTFQSVPTYSWTIMVIAHELGHLLGSQHTHACVWNGNGTAIDGCAGFTEGSCGNPGVPQNGGSIMSYCHLTSAGINFNVGFGPQPGAAIFNFVDGSSCIHGNDCGGGPPPPPSDDSCSQYTTILEITLDNFGPETTWTLENEAQQVLHTGGPYPKKQAGVTKRDTFCLPEACYVLRINDEHEDGLCCDYGLGGYRIIGPDNQLIAVGDTFSNVEVIDFCLPEGNPPIGSDTCINVNFNDYEILSYGQTQDAGTHAVQADGNQLFIRDNAWKAIELPYLVTEDTYVAFEFRSTIEGEIHGIGFDDNEAISPNFTFRVHGTQAWGIGDFDTYAVDGQWQSFTIPVGDYMTGEALYLFFCADHDLGLRNGNSYFRNVRVYENAPCEEPTVPNLQGITVPNNTLAIAPNPAAQSLQFAPSVAGRYQIVSGTGQVLMSGQTAAGRQEISIQTLPQGTYLLRYINEDGTEITERFIKL